MFPYQDAIIVLERANDRCENPLCKARLEYELVVDEPISWLHHVFFRSQYQGDDRNQAWNAAAICRNCHNLIHHSGTDPGLWLDWLLKERAQAQYPGEAPSLIESYRKRAWFKADAIVKDNNRNNFLRGYAEFAIHFTQGESVDSDMGAGIGGRFDAGWL